MRPKFALLLLALASLACLETTIQAAEVAQPAHTAVPATFLSPTSKEPESGAIIEPETWNVTPKTQCAIVTADQALNLRAEPNNTSRVIKWLRAGEIVTITATFREWHGVTAGTATGYAHSAYLQETECE